MIKLQCRCGHTLSLPDRIAGQKIRCKRCQKVMRVPPPSHVDRGETAPESDLGQSVLVQGSRQCPGCGKIYPPAITVCVECGLNVDSGAQLYVSLEDPQAAAEAAETKPGLFAKIKKMLGLR